MVAVARYYFHLHECGTIIPDEDGVEIEDPADIREHALREARGVMAAEVVQGTLCLGCCLEIYDENKRLVLTLPFKDAVILAGI